MVAMKRLADPAGEARNDYDIFSDLAGLLGKKREFTEGRSPDEWLRHMYERTRVALADQGLEAPAFDTFWERGELILPQAPDDGGSLRAFRNDPLGNPLPTPSGRIQISSGVIASFSYADCPGHPAWLPPDMPGDIYPLYLIANQPATRLHSQLDYGEHSQAHKRRGREVCAMHPATAAARGIADNDPVRIFNERGSCLAVAELTADMRQDVVQLPTGAWYDPGTDARGLPMCIHGNPNVLTRDVGTSSLAQGSTGQLTTVQVERYEAALPPVRAYDPPPDTPHHFF